MSADRLREAARVLRERAEAATPGPWLAMEYDDNPGDEGVALLGAAATVTGSHMIGYFHVGEQSQMEADGDYARTMHPGVGLALADWLDAQRRHVARHECEARCEYPDGCYQTRIAYRLADLILGAES